MFNLSLKAKWDYENSIAFAKEQAEERGREKVRITVTTNLIIQMDCSDEQIARVIETLISFVEQIRKNLRK